MKESIHYKELLSIEKVEKTIIDKALSSSSTHGYRL